MAIGDDFTIDFTDRKISHTANNNTYTINALYSWLQDQFDELTAMDDEVPMSAQTPNAYTMLNGWWLNIDENSEAHKYLKEGAIETSGYDASVENDGIRLLKLDAGWTNCVTGDIGREVGYSGGAPNDTGTLLGYDNVLGYWWVRVDDTGDTFANTSTDLDLDDGAGTGGGDLTDSGGSNTGEELFANVYTLGTIESVPAPQVYIFQDGGAIAEWSDKDNWDRGHIDVVIQVKEAGTEIALGVVDVFARQAGDLFDNFQIDLSNGGRNAVPLSTADDLNNDTGDYYLFYDNETTAFTTLGQIITGGTSTATAELVAATDWGSSGILTLRGIKGAFQDAEEIIGSTEGQADVNGTVGDTLLTYDTETSGFTTAPQVITGVSSGAQRILRAIQDDGAAGKLLAQADDTQTGTDREPEYTTFTDGENVTGASDGDVDLDADSITLVSGWSDITIALVNGACTHGGTAGSFTEGEQVGWNDGSAQTAIVLADSGSALTLGNCTSTSLNTYLVTGELSGASCTPSQDLQSAHTMDKNFSQQAVKPYDVIVEGGSIYETGRTLAQVYEYLKFICQEDSSFDIYTVVASVITVLDGEEYQIAYTGYTPVKSAPFGAFAGGKMFGAQGVWVEGMAADQSYQFIDSDGDVQEPYDSVTISISEVVSGDRVSVFRTTGGVIDTDLYQSHAANNSAGDSTFETDGTPAVAVDTPDSGILRIVDASEDNEHRMRYASWAGAVFTLPTKISGSTTSAGGSDTINDSGASFLSEDIEVGDICRNGTSGAWAQVVEIVSDIEITTTSLLLGGDQIWDNGDTYEFHTLPVAYVAADTVYVPFLDEEAAATIVEETVLYTADRSVMIRVRNAGDMLPFETTGTVNNTGLSVAAIRTPDNIYA